MDLLKRTAQVTLMALFVLNALGDEARTYEEVDQYVKNFNELFTMAAANPTDPGKVLELPYVKTFSEREKQLLSTGLVMSKGSNWRLGRKDSELVVFDLDTHKRMLTLNVADLDRSNKVSYRGKSIDIMRFFGEGELETRTNELAAAISDFSRQGQAQSLMSRSFEIALSIFSYPFRIASASADAIPMPKGNNDLRKAIAAGGKCVNYGYVVNPASYCPGSGPRSAPSVNLSVAAGEYQYKVKDKQGKTETYDHNGNIIK